MIKKLINEKEIVDITNIDKESFSSPWSFEMYTQMSKNSKYKFYLYFDEEILGYAVILDQIDSFELMKIAVDKKHRRSGIGKKILEKVLNEIDKDLFLEVRLSNEAAKKLYEKLEFKKISVRKNYYKDNNDDALIFRFEKGE